MRVPSRLRTRTRQSSGATSTETLVITGILVAILIVTLGYFRTYIRVSFVNLAAKITCAINSGGPGCTAGAGAPAGGATGPGTAGTPAVNPQTGLVQVGPGGAGGTGAGGGAGTLPPATTGLGAGVDKFLNASPEYAQLVRDFIARGGTIVIGPAGGGSSYNRELDVITIDANDIARGNIADIVGTLSHELGHANFAPPYIPPAGLTKEEYVRLNVNSRLSGEGEAVLRNFEMRDSLVRNGGSLADVRGRMAPEYERIYEQYLADGDREKARAAIGAIVAESRVSIPPNKQYKDYYGDIYINKWNETVGGAT